MSPSERRRGSSTPRSRADAQQVEGSEGGAGLEPGRARRPAGRVAPGRQRHRDRQIRSFAAAGVQACPAVRDADRGHLSGRGGRTMSDGENFGTVAEGRRRRRYWTSMGLALAAAVAIGLAGRMLGTPYGPVAPAAAIAMAVALLVLSVVGNWIYF